MKSQIVLIALLIGAVLGSGVGVVYTHHANRQFFVRLQRLQTDRDKLEVEWESLQLEQSALVTDAVVEEMAQRRLNMSTPDPGEVFYITPHE